ncbi:hypothetical protein XENTR_v10023927 [Xenopus tropicalis]|uniref:Proline rich 35 n=1 Tax=Xenopus tropicalis TaxID=8364 RepID=A0A6I8RSU6_XENTR|nr:proline-rich protein 35 [Xenopus tropicalis]KAE8579165.1 hypothetical protein XENTR_v10023927 [Xenopus tropicalis]KAE8579166.1 hypothetical protein XENTR_v10023927 [Xenopus tropicalis]
MSKEEEGGCKLSSACKHKERKPKKPHYIPRPWGKPYNYKCFQCPFTCMEKSHLYNHMKYSLCKNSLSLLIESDWPYKKSNFLIPEMHVVQETQLDSSSERQEACDSTGPNASKNRQAAQKASANTTNFQEEEGEEDEEDVSDQSQKGKPRILEPLQISPCKSDANISMTGLMSKKERSGKEGEPEFIITNVFSLEGQGDKEREDPRLSKAPRKPLSNAGGARSEHWKLLSSSAKKNGPEIQAGSAGANIIPCYQPSTYTDYQEHQGLSLLGINYPLNTSLFSYLSPTVSSSSAQLPFLASTAQLMQPASQFQTFQSTERSSFLPRFYYPLLFEHAFNTGENKVAAAKPVSMTQVPGHLSFMPTPKAKTEVETLKTCLHKSPETKSNISWGPSDKVSKQMSHHKSTQDEEVKWTSQIARDVRQHQKTSGSCIAPLTSIHESSISQKGAEDGSVWAEKSAVRYLKRKAWLQSNGKGTPMDQTALLDQQPQGLQNSNSCSPIATSPNVWHEKSPMMEPGSCKRRRESDPTAGILVPKSKSASLLIGDFSRTLEEYGKVERKLSNLASEDSSQQKALVEQLGKIRLELLHIHHTLEKTPCLYEGPLDLSVKRAEDVSMVGAGKTAPGDLETPPLSECLPKQLVKVELMPPELATCYVRPTKCEADSSVLLCPDGRIGGPGMVQTHISIQDEGAGVGVNIGFSKEQKQGCENV